MGYLDTAKKVLAKFEEKVPEADAWRKFYPDLDPEEWAITVLDSGVSGKKVKGQMSGTVGFFIPDERLRSGPTPKKKPDRREEWCFEKIRIPRLDRQGFDEWMVGTRLGTPGQFKFWAVRTEKDDL